MPLFDKEKGRILRCCLSCVRRYDEGEFSSTDLPACQKCLNSGADPNSGQLLPKVFVGSQLRPEDPRMKFYMKMNKAKHKIKQLNFIRDSKDPNMKLVKAFKYFSPISGKPVYDRMYIPKTGAPI